jgi:hypothetical protein
MDRATALKLQQTEFFLLHSLVVDELRLLKRSKRMTPAHLSEGTTVCQRTALIGRLFRSFVDKVFRRPFIVSKRPYYQEFTVSMDCGTRESLRRLNEIQPDLCRTLQPTTDEIGLIRFDFPHCLTISIGIRGRYRNRYYGSNIDVADIGIGRHCLAVKATLDWKRRLDAVLSAGEDEMIGPPEPKRNQAQEQLEAVIREAAEAGRL